MATAVALACGAALGMVYVSHRQIRGQTGDVAGAAQQVADDLVASGVKIIFNYSDALLSVPSDVTVHTSSPAVELLYALYFYLS